MLLCVLLVSIVFFFFFKQKTAYEMRISDWSSDVCSSDLRIDGSHKSSVYYQQNLDPYAFQGPRTIVNARVGIETGSGVTFEAFARNLFNDKYVNFVYPSPLSTGLYVGYVGDPRQFGVRARYSF